MKVLDLRCANGHGFEGWFASDDDFLSQNGRGLVACPLCADCIIARLPSAPRLNLSGARAPAADTPAAPASAPASAPAASTATSAPSAPSGQSTGADLQLQWLQAVHHVLRNTEDVGARFPEEARRIHYGETAHRGIRGQATPQERAALADEGIEVMPIALPVGLDGPVH